MKKTETQKNNSILKYTAFMVLPGALMFSIQTVTYAAILCLPQATANMTADSYTVDMGGSTVIHWTSTQMSDCTVTKNGSQQFGAGTSGNSSTGALDSQTSYSLSCSPLPAGTGMSCGECMPGPCSKTITINVNVPPPAPIVTLKTSPSQVDLHGTSQLSWTISGADSCSMTSTLGNWTVALPSIGSVPSKTINDITTDQQFTLTCTKNGASSPASASASIGVNSLFIAWPRQVDADPRKTGGSSLLQWISAIGGDCTLSGGGLSVATSSSGFHLVPIISSYKSYSLSCTSGGKTSTANASVSITPRIYCNAL
jgi:hypothetical protein